MRSLHSRALRKQVHVAVRWRDLTPRFQFHTAVDADSVKFSKRYLIIVSVPLSRRFNYTVWCAIDANNFCHAHSSPSPVFDRSRSSRRRRCKFVLAKDTAEDDHCYKQRRSKLISHVDVKCFSVSFWSIFVYSVTSTAAGPLKRFIRCNYIAYNIMYDNK